MWHPGRLRETAYRRVHAYYLLRDDVSPHDPRHVDHVVGRRATKHVRHDASRIDKAHELPQSPASVAVRHAVLDQRSFDQLDLLPMPRVVLLGPPCDQPVGAKPTTTLKRICSTCDRTMFFVSFHSGLCVCVPACHRWSIGASTGRQPQQLERGELVGETYTLVFSLARAQGRDAPCQWSNFQSERAFDLQQGRSVLMKTARKCAN